MSIASPQTNIPDDTSAEFRTDDAVFAQNWDALANWLRDNGLRFDASFQPRQFAGGVGNFNYLLRIDERFAVLRRPPPGPRPAGANDMSREYRVLSALNPHWKLVPAPIALCADDSVLGAPFLISEYRAGKVIRGAAMPGACASGERLGELLVDLLAQLHAVPTSDTRVRELGSTEEFARRTVAGWKKRAMAASQGKPGSELVDLTGWLESHTPDHIETAAVIHNDFKLDNVVLNADRQDEAVAVLDWDMATLGDPLFDLATLLSYWARPGDPAAMHAIQQMPTATPGFSDRSEIADVYAAKTGNSMSALPFYRVLAQFKLAVVLLQLHARYLRAPERFPQFGPLEAVASGMARFALDIAAGRTS